MEERIITLNIPDDLINLLTKAKYVSFDIFDTAILRIVQTPEDIFTLMDKYFMNIKGDKLSFDFRKARIESEKKARKVAWNYSGSVEITIDDIYKCLCEDFNLDHNTVETLKKIEIEAEINACVRNEFIYLIYKYCLDNNKDVIFLSDMYLPEKVIEKILKKCNYNKFKKLYISSAYVETKSNGGLYKLMLSELNCRPEEILHIGDNHDSDIRMAKTYGIITYHYDKCINRAKKAGEFSKSEINTLSVEESIYNAMVANKFYSSDISDNLTDDEFWYRFGYKYAGILFFGFNTWLRQKAIEDSVEKLYFLSRDGYIMKIVYDILSSSVEDAPSSEYMYASRRSLNIPGITQLDDKAIDFLVSGTSTLRVEQFLKRIGLDPDDYIFAIRDAGFSKKDDRVITGEDYGKLRKLFTLISKDIEAIASKEREFLQEYFNSIGIFKYKKIGVVDIGWHGTLQYSLNNIFKIIGGGPAIKGYYLGTWHKARKLYEEGIDMSAYICEFGEPKKYHDILKLCVEIFEFMHTAPHGSVVKFERINGKVEPTFDKHDCDPIKIKKAELLQRGALDFVKDIVSIFKHFNFLEIPVDLVLKPIYRVLMHPTPDEAVKLGNLEHAEGFGDVYLKRHIAKPPGFLESLFKPQKFFLEYKKAFWRRGYIKRFISSRPRII